MGVIERVDARSVRVPLRHRISFSSRSVAERWYTLVRLIDTDGCIGIGFCYAGSDAGTITTTAVRDLLAPVLKGQASAETSGLWQRMYDLTLLHGRTGLVMRALSAIDIALWDLNARSVARPLWQYLGAHTLGPVPAYASGGYYLDGKGLDGLSAEVEGYVNAGFDAVKIKVGRASVTEDAERVAAARAVLGPDRLLMLDANNAWQDVPTALTALRAYAPADPYWIEEPFSPDDILSHARLAQQTSILVATGEIEAGRWRHLELLRSSAVAVLQTDAAVCGGITEFLRIAHLADAFGVPMAPHWFHDLHIHLVAATSNGRWVEYFPDDTVMNLRLLLDRELEVARGGRLTLPTGPGLGFGFDEAAVSQFAVDPWS